MDLIFGRTPLGYCHFYFQFEREHRVEIEPIVSETTQSTV